VITIDKYISSANRTFGYFKEKSIVAGPGLLDGKIAFVIPNAFDPIVQKTTIHIADIIPDAVGIREIDHQVILAYHAIALIENLYGRWVVAGDFFDIIARENIFFQQNIIRADNVNSFSARIAYPAMTNR
jgi:hypothetical protein